MKRQLDLPAALKRAFQNHHRKLARQRKEIGAKGAKALKTSFETRAQLAELDRRLLRVERYKKAMLMIERKGTFGVALSPICPVCLIDHDKTLFLEERNDHYQCRKCRLVIEVEP